MQIYYLLYVSETVLASHVLSPLILPKTSEVDSEDSLLHHITDEEMETRAIKQFAQLIGRVVI